jgi:type I restriction enzyme S subunit
MKWEKVKLEDLLVKLTNGVNASQSADDSGWAISRIETIWNGEIDPNRVRYITPDEQTKAKYQLKKNDILFSHINSPEHIGKTAIYEDNPAILIHGINLLLLRCDERIIFAKYLLHYLKTPNVRVHFRERCKKAVNQASLNQQDLKSLKIPLPPLDEQKRIAAILDDADALRRTRRESLTRLDELAQSLFLEMFGDPATNPKGWEVLKLSQIAIIERNGIDASSIESGTTYIGLENIQQGGDFLNVGTVEQGELASNKFRFTNQHLLFGKLRPYLCKIARPNFHGICSTDILPILPQTNMNREYLLSVLRHPHFVDMATSLSTGANLPRLSPTELGKFPIPLPPFPLQQSFARQIEELETIKTRARAQLLELDALFASLQERAFLGQL